MAVFDQLKRIFAEPSALATAGDSFSEMVTLVQGMILTASQAYWGMHLTPEERRELFDTDVRVNQLQRQIRQQVVLQLSGSESSDIPHGLLLMSLVKDAERLGDYAKNLAEVHDLCQRGPGDLPAGPFQVELRRIADFVETLTADVLRIYQDDDRARAQSLSIEGKKITRACEALIGGVAGSPLDAAIAVDLVLAARFYKRITGHLLNLLSSVLMPLHELDYQSQER
jgi:phosphate uptake regulator